MAGWLEEVYTSGEWRREEREKTGRDQRDVQPKPRMEARPTFFHHWPVGVHLLPSSLAVGGGAGGGGGENHSPRNPRCPQFAILQSRPQSVNISKFIVHLVSILIYAIFVSFFLVLNFTFFKFPQGKLFR